MALFNEVGEKAVSLAKTGSKKLKNTGKIAALKLNSKTAQDEIDKLYVKLGKRYYKDHGLAPEAGYEKLCDHITDLMTAISENDAAITDIKIDGVIDEVVVDPDELD
jgi:hypothetical protein